MLPRLRFCLKPAARLGVVLATAGRSRRIWAADRGTMLGEHERAAGIEAFGGAVMLLELPEPPPLEAGEVLIRVRAAGVGNWDEIVRTGGWDVGRGPPLALGVEAAGEVVEVAPGVEWPTTGMAVMTHPLPLPYQGCWAELLVAPASLLAEKPGNASWAQAGAFPVPALTAEQVVSEALDIQRGEVMLVNGAGASRAA
jgi:NADPH:quinone reductase-like Zn-dependent oxidoreductase